MLALAIAFLVRRRRIDPALLGAGLAIGFVLAALLVAHNLYFGGVFAVLPLGQDASEPWRFSRTDLLGLFSDEALMERVHLQLATMFFVGQSYGLPTRVALGVGILDTSIVWALCCLRLLFALRTASWDRIVVAAFPLSYLAPTFLMTLKPSYPRHLIAAYLAMGLATIFVETTSKAVRERQDAVPVAPAPLRDRSHARLATR